MGDGPEKEKDGEPARERIHDVNRFCSGERVIAKKNNEHAAHQNEQGGARRVRDLEFETAADKLTALPETATGFGGQYIDGTRNQTYDPAGNVIDLLKLHLFWFFETGKHTLIIVKRKMAVMKCH